MNVDEFLEKTIPKGQHSALTKYESDIFKLREGGLSLQQIVQFLAENGVTSSVANISLFIRKSRSKKSKAVQPLEHLTRTIKDKEGENHGEM